MLKAVEEERDRLREDAADKERKLKNQRAAGAIGGALRSMQVMSSPPPPASHPPPQHHPGKPLNLLLQIDEGYAPPPVPPSPFPHRHHPGKSLNMSAVHAHAHGR